MRQPGFATQAGEEENTNSISERRRGIALLPRRSASVAGLAPRLCRCATPAAKDRADAALIVRHLLELIDGGELDAPTWYQHRLVGVLLTLDPRVAGRNVTTLASSLKLS